MFSNPPGAPVMKLYIVMGFSLGPLSRAIAFTVSGRSYVSIHRTLTSPSFLARLPSFNPHILFHSPYRHISAFRPPVVFRTLPHISGRVFLSCENTYPDYTDTFPFVLPHKSILFGKLYIYEYDICSSCTYFFLLPCLSFLLSAAKAF